MLVHKIILANQNKVAVNGRHWLAQKIICVLKGISAYTQHYLIDKSYVENTKVFNCVLTQGILCRFVSWVAFLVEKVTFQTRMCFNKIIKYIDIIL